MRVFLTGATGFIGSAIAKELQGAGHQVLGLARNDQAVAALAQAGVEAHRGDLTDLDSLIAGAKACDGVIHTAFIHDFSRYEENAKTDRRAIEAMTDALAGSGKPFVSTSGSAMLTPGQLATEEDGPDPSNPIAHRAAAETLTLSAAQRGVRSSVMRLPPSVHGSGDHGFVPMLVNIARTTGIAAYVGDGANRWPAVHRLDVARLYRLALEQAAPGSRVHGVAEEGIPMRQIAETIGEGLGLPVRSLTPEEARQHFTWLAMFVAVDNPTSSQHTRTTLGWTPREAGLLADIRESGYLS